MTKSAWDVVWESAETSYADIPITQNQVFEHVKIKRLRNIFLKEKFEMLEVGCGTAFVSLYFAKKGAAVTCLDNNQNILRLAQENFKKEKASGKFVLGDAEALPFADNTFDIVVSFGLLEHFPHPSAAINEMTRVLKYKGLFFADIVPRRFSCQSFGNIFNFLASFLFWTLKGKPLTGWQKGIRNFRPLYYENSLSWQEYKKIIRSAGVKNVRVYGNRPFPRLTLPPVLDRLYAGVIKKFRRFWDWFDTDGTLAKFWGAGWWFWGYKRTPSKISV
ncbi:class I SAM-dependent methyltransferase [Candidatus Woesebacteria bacterium]|nr:class I SAM-dependent methyltransferase [Candidatus Woesebacteria bacterium]